MTLSRAATFVFGIIQMIVAMVAASLASDQSLVENVLAVAGLSAGVLDLRDHKPADSPFAATRSTVVISRIRLPLLILPTFISPSTRSPRPHTRRSTFSPTAGLDP